MKGSGMMKIADQYGIILAAPNGAVKLNKGYAWNIPGVITTAGTIPDAATRDDVDYITNILSSLVEKKLVDQSRVYVMGISGGGRMSSWLACVASERFAAVAPVVGLRAGAPSVSDSSKPDFETCNPSQPIPIISFAGNKDTTNPIEGGGSQYWQYSMKEAELRWATLNGCKNESTLHLVSEDILETRYTNCNAGAEVVTYVTNGAGHDLGADGQKMWDFFVRFRRGPDGNLDAKNNDDKF